MATLVCHLPRMNRLARHSVQTPLKATVPGFRAGSSEAKPGSLLRTVEERRDCAMSSCGSATPAVRSILRSQALAPSNPHFPMLSAATVQDDTATVLYSAPLRKVHRQGLLAETPSCYTGLRTSVLRHWPTHERLGLLFPYSMVYINLRALAPPDDSRLSHNPVKSSRSRMRPLRFTIPPENDCGEQALTIPCCPSITHLACCQNPAHVVEATESTDHRGPNMRCAYGL